MSQEIFDEKLAYIPVRTPARKIHPGGALSQLVNEVKSLKYDPPYIASASPTAAKIPGKEFMPDTNEFNAMSVSFNFNNDKCIFTLIEEDKPHCRSWHTKHFSQFPSLSQAHITHSCKYWLLD